VTRLRDYLLEPAAPAREVSPAERVAGPERSRRAMLATARAAVSAWLAPREATVASAAVSLAPTAAVVGAGSDATALGAALAIVLARHHGSSAALLCLAGTGLPAWRAPAAPAARRMSAALRARELPAQASGRLAIVGLSADPPEGAVDARRALAAAGAGSAAVLVLAGTRDPAFDRVLGHVDLAVAAVSEAAPDSLGALAVAGLAAAAPRAVGVPVSSAGLGRALASAGITVLPALRRSLEAACGQLP